MLVRPLTWHIAVLQAMRRVAEQAETSDPEEAFGLLRLLPFRDAAPGASDPSICGLRQSWDMSATARGDAPS